MEKEKISFLIVIIVLGSLLSPTFIGIAHATTGQVCLADPYTASSTNPCPASPPVFDGPPGQQIRIGVYLSGSDGLDGFDITLVSNHTVLRPAGADIAGTVLLGTPVTLAECLSGILIMGSSCSSADSVDTLHFSAVSALGQPLTSSPTSGLLFTAIYNITGVSSNATIGFQTGCSNTSIGPSVCVTITNGSTTPDSETASAASFSNSDSSTMATIILSSSQTLVGPEFPGASNSVTVTATAVNGYPGLATDSVIFTVQTSNPALTATVSGPNPCATSGTSCSISLIMAASTVGNFSATVYATYSSIDPSGNPDTLVAVVSLNVITFDFGFSISPTTLSFNSSTQGTATITLSSLNHFAGNVTITSGSTAPSGLTINYIPNPVTLAPDSTIHSTATFTANPTSATVYHAQIRATSGTRTKTSPAMTISVAVGALPDFSIIAAPSSVTSTVGETATSTISVTASNGFSNSVSLSTNTPTGIACSLSESSIASSGTSTLSCSASQGAYNVTVTGASGSLVHSAVVRFAFIQAATGPIVCLATDGTNACPSAPPVITPPSISSQQLRVAVVIGNSATMSAFDIILQTNSSILKPADAINGNVLNSSVGSPTVIAKCIGDTGTGCGPSDNKNTLHYAVVSSGQAYAPVNGLLFTAVYNVTGVSTGTVMGFQTGCSSTSILGGICVTIGNGTPVSNVETVQTALFANLPSFGLQTLPAQASLKIAPGTSSSSLILSLTSFNSFAGIVTVATIVSPTGPTVQLSPTNSELNATSSPVLIGVTVTVPQLVPPGSYLLNFTATGGGLSRSLTVPVTVLAADFSISTSPPILTFNNGQSSMATITIASIASFSGTVTLTTSASSSLITTLSQESLLLAPNGTNSSIVTINTENATQPLTYYLTISGNSGSITHNVTLTINIADFLLYLTGTNATHILASPGQTYAKTVYLHSINNFTGLVNVSTQAPAGFTAYFLQIGNSTGEQVLLGPNSDVQFDLFVSVGSSTPTGNYTIFVVAAGPTLTHEIQIAVVVSVPAPPPPSFSMSVSPSSLVLEAGTNSSSTISLLAVSGFTGNVFLNASIYPTPPTGTLLFELNPSSVFLTPNGSATSQLTITTTRATPAEIDYVITILATNGTLSRSAVVIVFILPAPHVPPVANFTFSPSSPVVGEQVTFDGSSSFAPDGYVVAWTWNFGDSSGIYSSSSPIEYHSFSTTGNYTVTLTVQDDFGLASSKSLVVSVMPQPQHDVGITQLFVYPNVAVSTSEVQVEAYLTNIGLSNETVSLTAYYGGHVIQTRTGIFLQGCRFSPYPCYYNTYEVIDWNTTGVQPGNYTISASISLPLGEQDPTPQDNSITDGTITILPAPTIVLNPNSGQVGAKIQISGSGFVSTECNYPYYCPYPEPIWVTFDNNFLGEAFAQNGTFTFTFDVIQAQPGPHLVIARDLNTEAVASTVFTVTASPSGTLTLTINTGTIYFSGDTVTVYVQTSFNGVPTGNAALQLLLFRPNGSNVTLRVSTIATGLFEATYTVPRTGPLGTYLISARAHESGSFDSSAITSFEVKPTWLSSNGQNIAGVAGAVGLVGLVAVSWKKGYFRKKRKDEPPDLF